MEEIARRRSPGADIRVGEIEEPPFVHALAEARRMTKPGGVVVAAVWDAAEKCELAASCCRPPAAWRTGSLRPVHTGCA
jgi:hypothetical protein